MDDPYCTCQGCTAWARDQEARRRREANQGCFDGIAMLFALWTAAVFVFSFVGLVWQFAVYPVSHLLARLGAPLWLITIASPVVVTGTVALAVALVRLLTPMARRAGISLYYLALFVGDRRRNRRVRRDLRREFRETRQWIRHN